MQDDPIVILSATRTPIGNLLGSLASLTAPQLGSEAIRGCIHQAKLTPQDIHSVIMGCVLPAGLGQAPARQAALGAGIPVSTGCTTVNKMCGSGMKAVMLAHDAIVAGSYDVMLAGGMESMSNAPYLLPKARAGYRLGHDKFYDHLFLDGLEDAYDKGKLMGWFADQAAEKFNISRESQDDYALASVTRAQLASTNGHFKAEITPVVVKDKKGETVVALDEGPQTAKPDKIRQLKPAFQSNGSVTAANASSISDGAAALVLTKQSIAEQNSWQPIAKIIGHSTHSQEPQWFTTAPIGAIQKLLAKLNWTLKDVDLFEINEAFAVVSLLAMQELAIPHQKINIHGGACVLGHPIGASGARIIVTLIHALKQHHLKRGIAALCIGGGEATAIGVEIV